MRSLNQSGLATARRLSALSLVAIGFIAGCDSSATDPGFVGTPAVVQVASGDGISVVVADTAGPFAVKVVDTAGTGVSGVPVTFAVTSGNATLINTTGTTNADGSTFTSAVIGHTSGTITITATATGIANAGVFHVNVLPAAPSKFFIAGGDGQSNPVGTALAENLVIGVTDLYDNPVQGVSVTFVASKGTLTTPTPHTAANGRAGSAFTLSPIPGAATITATASINGAPMSVTFTATGN